MKWTLGIATLLASQFAIADYYSSLDEDTCWDGRNSRGGPCMVVHDTKSISWVPRGETVLQLVWGTDGRSVRDVMVAGQTVVRDGACTTVDVGELHQLAADAQRSLLKRAGLTYIEHWKQ